MTVYFDNAATTKPSSAAVSAAEKMMTECYGNPSSGHALGRLASEALETARNDIAAGLGASRNEIFFTSGGTEADNWAIISGAKLMRHRGKHIISSASEHEAVLKPLEELCRQGFEVELLRPDNNGAVSAEAVAAALRDDTVLISLMLVNNETGAITPIPDIAGILRAKRSRALLHTDAVQGFLRLPFTAKSLGADMISISAHKIHGIKGAGALFVKNGIKLPAMIFGGGQEKGFRSGTEALPQIAAFAAAVKDGIERRDSAEKLIRDLREHILAELSEKLPEAKIICREGSSHILCLSLPGYKSETLMNYLDARGICVSKGSACKRGRRSHVLEAIGLPTHIADGAIRLSFSYENTKEEGSYFADQLVKAKNELFSVDKHGRK